MNNHLTDEQLTDWLAGAADVSTGEHLQVCGECRVEAEEMRRTASGFGQAMRRVAAASEPRRPSSPALFPRWAVAGAVALLLVVSGVWLSAPAPQPEAVAEQAVAQQDPDDAFLMKLQSDLQRDVPSALEPAVLIVSERNRLALEARPYSQGETQ